ncbi:septum site-determining protein MinC [Desulfopila sp. IMCC35008]|uniref:septum site-determining protein MinC n=1 Tax=Desulfopila sp. IMCC35008 TaxID=2653858 RepID=UPI0013D5BBAC|nr:septum site-determining protein MinC [Desulfopila sp. IMCC35008]
MSPITPEAPTEEVAAALKVKTVSLLVLEIYESNLVTINGQLQEKAKQGPDFFRSAPVLFDFKDFPEDIDGDWLDDLYRMVTSHQFVPVGITGAPESLENSARIRGIAVWPSKKPMRSTPESQPTTPRPLQGSSEQTSGQSYQPTMIVHQTVRSGQRIYAQGGDLIVLSSVNTGAEIMADGHIHVYGNLRGRALAGVTGWQEARIFCHDLQADLVAIAGYYTIHEDIPENRRNTAVQISLQQESLNINPLIP